MERYEDCAADLLTPVAFFVASFSFMLYYLLCHIVKNVFLRLLFNFMIDKEYFKELLCDDFCRIMC